MRWYVIYFCLDIFSPTCLPLGAVLTVLTEDQAFGSRPARCGISLSHSNPCRALHFFYTFLHFFTLFYTFFNTFLHFFLSSVVWDISLPRSNPCRALHFFPESIFYRISLYQPTIDQYHATHSNPHCELDYIYPQFKNLICYKCAINIALFTWINRYIPSCVWYTCCSLQISCIWARGRVYPFYLPPSLPSKGWFWELLSALP